MGQIWIPVSLTNALCGAYYILNRLALYHLIETFIKYRAHPGRHPHTYDEFTDSIGDLKTLSSSNVSTPRRVYKDDEARALLFLKAESRQTDFKIPRGFEKPSSHQDNPSKFAGCGH